MKNILATMMLMSFISFSCSSILPKNLFNKTPHEKYAEKIEDSDLSKTVIGQQWIEASKAALADAQTIQLPYRINGYFKTDKPRALGLEFKAKRGEKISFSLTRKEETNFVIYADLF